MQNVYSALYTVIMGIIIEGSYVECNLSTVYSWPKLNLLSLMISFNFLRIYMGFPKTLFQYSGPLRKYNWDRTNKSFSLNHGASRGF